MITQIFIMILGASAIYLTTLSNAMRKYGYVLGLLSQPFWFYTTYSNEQWGIFIMCFFYTFSWASGVWNIHWYTNYYRKSPQKAIFILRKCRCGNRQIFEVSSNKWIDLNKYVFKNTWEKEAFNKSRIIGDPSNPHWNDKIS